MKNKQLIFLALFIILCVALIVVAYKENKKGIEQKQEISETALPILGLTGKMVGIYDSTLIIETESTLNSGEKNTSKTAIVIGSDTEIFRTSQTNKGIERKKAKLEEIKIGSTLLITSKTDIRNASEVQAKEIDIVE